MQKHHKPYKGIPMEGILATWYAKNTGRSLDDFTSTARQVALRLQPDARVLEVAPGPGYLAIALARLGAFRITGLDISRSFVRIATENAARAGVAVEFQHGDAAALPFPADAFDFIVCRAAFKNFGDPVGALCEMHRVLRPGGEAVIIDMRKDASNEAIDITVSGFNLGRFDAMLTGAILKQLRKRAYSKLDFRRMAEVAQFPDADIQEGPIGFEVWLRK
jgi:ubiquinone/menaquinone biosynthesis C-methylase UbiE